MITAVLRAMHRLDDWLRESFGRPYHVVLAIGLVVEIIAHIRELHEAPKASTVIKMVLTTLLYLLLIVHQLGELSDHAERRHAPSES